MMCVTVSFVDNIQFDVFQVRDKKVLTLSWFLHIFKGLTRTVLHLYVSEVHTPAQSTKNQNYECDVEF